MERDFLLRAVELADSTAGKTAPHPNHACILVRQGYSNGLGHSSGNGIMVGSNEILPSLSSSSSSSSSRLSLSSQHANAIVGEGFLYAQGCTCAEEIAVLDAREAARGGVAYVNLEPVAAPGDTRAVDALIQVCFLGTITDELGTKWLFCCLFCCRCYFSHVVLFYFGPPCLQLSVFLYHIWSLVICSENFVFAYSISRVFWFSF